MAVNQFSLMNDRRFLPLFITQFLGAFHDNVFKNALVFMMLYGTLSQGHSQTETELLVSIAAGVFIFPFIIFSALGGQLADKFPKQKVIRMIKLAEIAIGVLGIATLFTASIPLSFITLFVLGAQSAFFGPSKFAILPDHLHTNELIAGNALLNTGTFLAILFGTIAGISLMSLNAGLWFVSAFILASAIIGYVASRAIPQTTPKVPDLKLNYNPVTETLSILKYAFSQKKGVVQSILGVSWFFFLGSMFMAQFANFTKGTLSADETVLTLFLIIFSIGIAIGGLLNNRLLKGRVEALYVPLAALGITLFSIDLYFASNLPAKDTLMGLRDFLSVLAHWRVLFDVLMIAVCGGLFVVPLNAIIQHHTEERHRARIIAAAGILDAVFIFGSSAFCALLIVNGWAIREIIILFALANAVVALYVCTILPDYLLKSFLQGLFKLFYRVEVRGLENFEKAGNRAVIISNHVSLIDPPLLAAFLPGRPMFAVNSFVAKWAIVKPFLKIVDMFPLDPTNPFSIKSLIKEVEKDKHCVIFPEGRLTETGALMKVYEGPGMIADKADAVVIPVRLDGVQHTPFARLKGKVPLKSFPKITITVLPPRKFKLDDTLSGRERRASAARTLYQIMEDMMFMTSDREQTLYDALLKARHINGDEEIIIEDAEFKPVKFKRLIQGSMVLGRKFSKITEKSENVGLLLPNSVSTVVTFFGLQAYGRVTAMLNFSAGARALVSACQTAQIKTVISSHRFIEMGRLEGVIQEIEKHAKIVYLEDIKKEMTLADKLFGLMANPASVHKNNKIKPDDPALILFTSGSEGMPKGVVLSHGNIMSNIVQLSSRVDFNRQDVVFNCLPMFHSFGLTGGTLLPILSGVKTFLYPSPLHYRIVPELIYSTNASIMFGTDTFLNGYARMADPYDFYRMRYIFAGAEKVKEETRQLYMNKYGVRILEGYGATETAPVLAVNAPMHLRTGTVGRMLSGIEYRLEDVPGVKEGGRLFVKGPNVMLGYYHADHPGIIDPPKEGWYDTGDIVSVDEQGFVKILGRAKRFAKIAGEMISLASVESMVQKIYPEAEHAVAALPDEKKGEQLILVTTQKGVKKADLSSYASTHKISELAVPRKILEIDALPVLGSGKTDYAKLQAYVEAQL